MSILDTMLSFRHSSISPTGQNHGVEPTPPSHPISFVGELLANLTH